LLTGFRDMGTVTRDRFVPDKKLLSVDDSVGE
jgi:hypothetical protein